jgi:hypothetical protein
MNLWRASDDADDNGLKDKVSAHDDDHSLPSHEESNKRGLLLLPLYTSRYQTSGYLYLSVYPTEYARVVNIFLFHIWEVPRFNLS